jgi:hypothetical protein
MGGACGAHGEVRGAYNIFLGDLKGVGVDGRITLRWILGKKGLGMWIGFIWLRIGTGGEVL